MSQSTDHLTPLQRAFIALESTREQLARAQAQSREPIAIIGLGCRVPGGGDDAASLWALMRDGVDATGPLPAERWDVEGTYDPDPEAVGRITARGGGFLKDVRGFDPAHFGITRREAQGMDPQQRLLLEVAWEALEHAGQPPDRLQRSATGVYVGVTGSDWPTLQFATHDRHLLDAHFASGMAHSIVSGRLSYLLGLQGPALTIDTACSSSLVAVHLACQALRAGDCRLALAGGVNLILGPELYIALSRSRMLAPDGRCKTFDAAADGFARGEGCGLVVLKKLRDAQADGDRILAVIRASALNQDGPSSGLTAPNGPAQAAVIREALARAGIAPRLVGYIEAHGTGTQLGDPLEVQALGDVFGADRDAATPLYIGSVKTNVGHLEAAAGVTGLIKLVLALGAQQLPPHLHFKQPSPHITWDDWPVAVPTALMPWAPIDGRRVAGVSSFGFSGTNAHVVVEEAPAASTASLAHSAATPVVVAAAATATPVRPQLFLLSARDEAALRAMAARQAVAIAAAPAVSLQSWCYSAATGRAQLAQRATVLARTADELRERLLALSRGEAAEGVRCARVSRRDPPRVAFLFTGQGSQYAGMARGLDGTQPVFRAALDRCAAVLDPLLGQPLRELLFAPAAISRLDDTGFTQPALFAVEYALAELWRHWGVAPDALIGHSVGEIVAACVGGVLTLPDALALIAERGRLMQSLPAGGAMSALFAPEAEVAAAIAARPGAAAAVSVAALNGPTQTVISGRAADVQAIAVEFAQRGLRVAALPVSHAFHSPLVEPVLDAFEATVAKTTLAPPTLRIVSNLSGQLARGDELTSPRYWRRHLREAVRFADGVRTLAALPVQVGLEIGPAPTLCAFAQSTLEAAAGANVSDRPAITFAASLRKGRPDSEQIQEALATLFLAGVAIDWRAVWSAAPALRVDLPTYAFQREPLWFSAKPATGAAVTDPRQHPLLGTRQRSAQREIVTFDSVLRAADVPFITDHRVLGEAILPATGFLELALAAGREVLGGRVDVADLAILEPLRFDGDESRVVQVLVRPVGAGCGAARFEVLSIAADDNSAQMSASAWTRHAEGRLEAAKDVAAAAAPVDSANDGTLDRVRTRCPTVIEASEHRAQLAARGLVFGPALHGVLRIHRGQGEALGEIELPAPAIAGRGHYHCHPALLDACVQVLSAALTGPDGEDLAGGRAWLPLAIGRLQLLRPSSGGAGTTGGSSGRLFSHARLAPDTLAALQRGEVPPLLRGEITVHDAAGVALVLGELAMRPARPSGPSPRTSDAPFFKLAWEPRAPDDAGWLPAPAALDAAAGPQLAQLVRTHGLESYQQAFVALESLSAAWIGTALRTLGLVPRAGEVITRAGLAARLGVLPLYERLLWRFIDILAEDGHLEAVNGSGWRILQAWPAITPEALQAHARTLHAQHADSAARIQLAERCGPHLAGILRGQVDPLACLFPNGSTELAESLYRDAPEARAFNQLLREAVRAVVAARPAERTLRVLEVGGGTGGTTSWVAPELPADATQYLFTDIGPSMVARARDKFAAHSFMDFQVLDLERAPQSQGLAGRRFDLILAANVVHATADLRQTLAWLKSLLAPGGTLLMLEVAGLERWIDITFGLTEGWWRFTDRDLRADYPLLSRPAWLDLLRSAGFEASAIGAVDERSREVLLAARRPLAPAPEEAGEAGQWLLLGEGHGLAAALAARLRASGQSVKTMAAGDAALGNAAALRAELQALLRAGGAAPLRGIVHLTALDLPAPTGTGPWREAQQAALGPVMTLVQALGGLSFAAGEHPRLWLVTRGAVSAGPTTSLTPLAPQQATVWGLARTLRLEHPELQATCVDLDGDATPGDACAELAEALREGSIEDQLARRADGWRVARLVQHVEPETSGGPVSGAAAVDDDSTPDAPRRLVNGQRGLIDDLALVPFTRRAPGPGEVEIRVVAGGLNFRDVMNALALRADPEPLGGECSGRIVAVGRGVSGFAPGDAVVAIAEASFATHAVAPVALVRPLPKGVGFAEAATLPFAFMTAWHALVELGGLQRGQSVLVHAAAGGVGMAALQIAQAAGARVFATAGSPAKRELLRARGAAVVLDSRSLRFSGEVLAHTGGRGVDLVLNSLAGDFIPASVRCLAADGCFLEIGKRDIWSTARFAGERPHGRYHAIDLAAMRYEDPQGTAVLFERVLTEVAEGRLRPLPLQTLAITRAADAFRCMAQARHVGKVVLVDQFAHPAALASLDARATYLVTGGLSGLGLLTAETLVEHGARHLLLVGRREPGAAALPVLARLREAGAEVRSLAADIGDPAAVRALVQGVPAAHPLRGVIHSAGALEDGALLQQDWPRFVRPLAAKLDGAWALHEATRGLPLDFFVLYSSIAGTLGSAGQGNHAAANAFMDALAVFRRSLGLPALSIAWGAWSETGAAAERQVDERVALLGLEAIAPAQGLAWLRQLMAGREAEVVASPIDFSVLLEGARAALPVFEHFRKSRGARTAARGATSAAAASGAVTLSATLASELAAAPAARRHDLLLGFVGEQVAQVIGAAGRDAVDPRQPLQELGLDSLMAVELRNRLATGLGLPQGLPATLVFDHPTLEALARVLARELPGGEAAVPDAGPPTAVPPADAVGAIDDLSDEEVERLFAKKLGRT